MQIIKIKDGKLTENDGRTIAAIGTVGFGPIIKDEEINNTIGFMDLFKKTNILFKIKNIKDKKGSYSNKGKRCSFGVNKINIVNRIKELSYLKYILNKSVIKEIKDINGQIYNKKNYTQYYEDNEGKLNNVNITSEQLCIETELLFRLNDLNKVDKKRWFFSTLENIRNNIVSK